MLLAWNPAVPIKTLWEFLHRRYSTKIPLRYLRKIYTPISQTKIHPRIIDIDQASSQRKSNFAFARVSRSVIGKSEIYFAKHLALSTTAWNREMGLKLKEKRHCRKYLARRVPHAVGSFMKCIELEMNFNDRDLFNGGCSVSWLTGYGRVAAVAASLVVTNSCRRLTGKKLNMYEF